MVLSLLLSVTVQPALTASCAPVALQPTFRALPVELV